MMYLELIWSFFQIGLFSIGGGYAALPLIQQQIVDIHGWMTLGEFADIITIAEMTPGPIAINAATFVGQRMGGVLGSVVCTLSCIAAPAAIVLTLGWLYTKFSRLDVVQNVLSGLRPAVVSLIGSAALSLVLLTLFGDQPVYALSGVDWISAALFAVALTVMRVWKPGPLWVMFGCGGIGVILYLLGIF